MSNDDNINIDPILPEIVKWTVTKDGQVVAIVRRNKEELGYYENKFSIKAIPSGKIIAQVPRLQDAKKFFQDKPEIDLVVKDEEMVAIKQSVWHNGEEVATIRYGPIEDDEGDIIDNPFCLVSMGSGIFRAFNLEDAKKEIEARLLNEKEK